MSYARPAARAVRSALCVLITVTACAVYADKINATNVPDLTDGGERPADARMDWNLGATGARGWMHSNRMETTDARQILVTLVYNESPADGVLQEGDVILGVNGRAFEEDPRVALGRALTVAETDLRRGTLSLVRWRDGQTRSVTLRLPVMGSYSETAPYNCRKTDRIIEQGCQAIARSIGGPRYNPHPIVRGLNALALLASGDEQYMPLIEREAQWAAQLQMGGRQTWSYAYAMIFLAEYIMATEDESVMPGLERLVNEAVTGQSAVGSWGHSFANDRGELLGYGMMNAPGVPLTIGMVLARQAGAEHEDLDLAIQRSVNLIRFYVGKGSIPYGDHHPWIQTHDDNGKNGMAALLFNLLGDEEATEYFTRMSVACHGMPRDEGHTGNFFNMLYALPGVAQSGPQATGAWMQAFGAHYYDLSRQWDGSFIHQGPPSNNYDSYRNWDCTGAYLLGFTAPRGNLVLTSPVSHSAPQVDRATADALINDGVGWSHNSRTQFYDALTEEELFERLSNWSPVVRERAALAMGRINPPSEGTLDRLITMLASDDLYTQLGACRAIQYMRGDRAEAVPHLLAVFEDADDLWLRVLAADALSGIGEPARVAIPTLMQRLIEEPDPALDPRGMEQRYLLFALFNRRGGLVGRSLDGVDREQLMIAVRAGLQNQDGRARGSLSSVYQNLSFEELRPLLPAIQQAIIERPPSGIMFSNEIRMAGLRLLAQHHVEEGIDLLIYYARHQRPHASEHRLPQIMDMLETYGVHAQRAVADLEALAEYFEGGEENFPRRLSQGKAQRVRQAIERIRAATDGPDLVSID